MNRMTESSCTPDKPAPLAILERASIHIDTESELPEFGLFVCLRSLEQYVQYIPQKEAKRAGGDGQ